MADGAAFVYAARHRTGMRGHTSFEFVFGMIIDAVCTAVALLARRVWLDTLAVAVLVALVPVFLWTRLQGLAG